MNSIQIIIYCSNKNKKNKFFVAPLTILKQFDQDNIEYYIEKGVINIMNKKFKIERSDNNAY